jgi:predicted acylesterase/phospholipase RssA
MSADTKRQVSAKVLEAIEILKAEKIDQTAEYLLSLSKELKSQNAFNYARQVLRRAKAMKELDDNPDLAYKIEQQYALCTYKDQDLTLEFRLDLALKILNEKVLDLKNSTDPETLGYAGATYKRKWEALGDKNFLIASLHYYEKGHGFEKGLKDGYPGINAAFIADQLAKLEEDNTQYTNVVNPNLPNEYRKLAHNIRTEINQNLTKVIQKEPDKKNWWSLVTIVESYFGLGLFEEAKTYLLEALKEKNVSEWEYETTTRQLAQLAILQADKVENIMKGAPGEVIKILAEAVTPANGDNGLEARDTKEILETAIAGKVGLALSGGGFRAALFHVGLLAKLAELDILRRVEVISCVSGGSIVGTCYYLALKDALMINTDANMKQAVYVEIVNKLEKHFLLGVQQNLRMRIFTNWWSNLKMLLLPRYTRTLKLGELYERELFAEFSGKSGEHWMTDLIIQPKGEPANFKPRYHNWYRKAKVPILIINATALNTGHNWQFTGSWMGEPPFGISAIDGNYRLRRLYYDQATTINNIRLGHAVAASSCVPVLFPPIQLKNIYSGINLKLVDGGVHDNQGTSSLIEQGCTVLLVSDASGQMNSENKPSSKLGKVLQRSNDILMERVRNAQYHDLQMRLRNKLLRGLMFIHLKLDLDVKSINWIDAPPVFPIPSFTKKTEYDVDKNFQTLLAGVRTDLDSFHNTEAYSLMKDAYEMSAYELIKSKTALKDSASIPFAPMSPAPAWAFNNAKPLPLDEPVPRMLQLLMVSASKLFKVFKLKPSISILLSMLVISIPTSMLLWIVNSWALIEDPFLKLITSILGGLLLGTLAFTGMMNLNLLLLDRLYKWVGKN